MSKSIGNVVDPVSLLAKYGPDSVRLYFLSSGPQFKDIDFCEDTLANNYHNQYFIDSFMNLLFRISGKKILKNLSGEINKP